MRLRVPDNHYHFITRWRIPGTVDQVFDILADPLELVRWWPAVYLDVRELSPGDERGAGRVIGLHTTGWLPYTLRWQFRVTAADLPHTFSLEAWGDLVGRGTWTLEQERAWVRVTYDWRVRAEKPLLRRLSFLLKPVFSANHRWAMARGEESLRLELARRLASSAIERARVPAPPGPTPNMPRHAGMPGPQARTAGTGPPVQEKPRVTAPSALAGGAPGRSAPDSVQLSSSSRKKSTAAPDWRNSISGW